MEEEKTNYLDSTYRSKIISNIIEKAQEKKLPLNIIKFTNKTDELFNEFTIISESLQINSLKLISQAIVSCNFEIYEGNGEDLYESCYHSFNDYIENDNDNHYFGTYEDFATFDMVFGATIQECLTSLVKLFETFSKEEILHDSRISGQELLLCILMINGSYGGYPDEIMFYYEERISPNVNV